MHYLRVMVEVVPGELLDAAIDEWLRSIDNQAQLVVTHMSSPSAAGTGCFILCCVTSVV